MIRKFGSKADQADYRDLSFYKACPEAAEVSLPTDRIDLSAKMHTPLDQEWPGPPIGSCTAHAGAALMNFLHPRLVASRLQIYYHARKIEGTQARDAGCETRSVMKALQKIGAIPEEMWPYVPERFSMPPPAITDPVKLGAYARLQNEAEFMSCLAMGSPFLCHIQAPDYFNSRELAEHGVFWLPQGRPFIFGPHALLCVGCDPNFRDSVEFKESGLDPDEVCPVALKMRNSAGSGWGLGGHFWLPLKWLTNPSTGGDCWWGGKRIVTADEPGGPKVMGVPVRGSFVA